MEVCGDDEEECDGLRGAGSDDAGGGRVVMVC